MLDFFVRATNTHTCTCTWYIYRIKLVRRLWQWLWHHCIRTRYIKQAAAEISLSVHRAHFIWYFQNCILYYAEWLLLPSATQQVSSTILSCVFHRHIKHIYAQWIMTSVKCVRFLFLLLGKSTPHFSYVRFLFCDFKFLSFNCALKHETKGFFSFFHFKRIPFEIIVEFNSTKICVWQGKKIRPLFVVIFCFYSCCLCLYVCIVLLKV